MSEGHRSQPERTLNTKARTVLFYFKVNLAPNIGLALNAEIELHAPPTDTARFPKARTAGSIKSVMVTCDYYQRIK